MIFFVLSAVAYALLTSWVAQAVAATTEEWGYATAHLLIAAALNAHLLYAARNRGLTLLSPPIVFLLASQLYFSINGLKYFSPIILHPQFNLSLRAQFLGSAAGALVLFAAALLVRRQRAPTAEYVFAWMRRYWPELRRLMWVAVIGSLGCKLALYLIGYGSPYTPGRYTDRAVRGYADFFLLFGNEAFGLSSLLLASLLLYRPREYDRPRPLTSAVALLGAFGQVAHTLFFLRGRLILLASAFLLSIAAEIRSRRVAELLLCALFLALPPASLLGVQLTRMLGRVNLPEETGLRLAIAAVNRRADLTDFATAIIVNSRGEAHDVRIIPAAVLNAVPRVIFPNKDQIVQDVYSQILREHLDWPAFEDKVMIADYQDSVFSAGVMSFGVIGFAIVPLALIWVLYRLTLFIQHAFKRTGYGLALVALALVSMRIEIAWSSIPLYLRQAILMAVVFALAVWTVREVRRVIVLAGRPPDSAR